ncbi:phosphotransferase family protein [Aspergillus vadensis CBS 113365]|uniref:Altered inheritance of mitochondria protein 9, mitochondrial n=1 Tax=Aspergillus vadensis (strain CBS 113365 / IMI 142717 / IBT 24658) TaxID=1448311 RepID=A0A319BET3_ASPVC|nr:phosphotransferase family protein [Aspergillus vadensis CBS 113365]PYH64433.1 phosphotransferase family protein [Aspergillus vadensis CBS 113365]
MRISSPPFRAIRNTLAIWPRKILPAPLSSRHHSHQHHSQPPLSNIIGNPQDFFRYTSGRWLWDEKQQLQERYREFNILELQKIAIQASSSESCLSIAKIGEGSYNKSFKLIMDNGKTVVARIPNPNAGPAYLTTASEVATMDFLRTILHIPVPEVLAWNSAVNSTNSIGAEYIVMEHAPGSNLADAWTDMDLEHKVQTMEDIMSIQQKLLSLRFSAYGCIFYKTDAPPGSQPAIVVGDNYPPEVGQNISENNGRESMDIDRGPWTSALAYIQALANREASWIAKHAKSRSQNDPLFTSISQNNPAEHLSLLQKYLTLSPNLIPHDNDITGSFLWHTDLRTPNIFVDDTGHITSIIDWQSTWTGPLFLEGRHPHFLDYNGEIILKPPKNFKHLDEDTQRDLRDQISKSILLYLYEKNTSKKNPLLDKVLRYPNCKILTHPIHFVGNTWDGDILPLRESLIQIQEDWTSLKHTTKECPITFTPSEIHQHHQDSEGWNEVQDFWDAMSGILSRDGWTSHETYDQAVSIYSPLQAIERGSSSSQPINKPI